MTKNYHTHLFRCKHAEGDVADYCRAALDAGLTVLGISDHAPLPDQRWHRVRMDMAELPAYCRSIDEARQQFPGLTVLKALECEYDAPYVGYYRDELLGQRGFDYLIGAVHWFPHNGEWLRIHGGLQGKGLLKSYGAYLIRSMASGLFAFMAHPDAFGNFYLNWDAEAVACSRDIFEAAQALKVPLEINAYGLRKLPIETPDGLRPPYPLARFWELAAGYDIRVIVNSDAHHPGDIVSKTDEALAIAEKYGLKVIDSPLQGDSQARV